MADARKWIDKDFMSINTEHNLVHVISLPRNDLNIRHIHNFKTNKTAHMQSAQKLIHLIIVCVTNIRYMVMDVCY